MKTPPTRELRKQRLNGIDLFRGIAAYAVCLIHADAAIAFSSFSTDYWMTGLTQLSRFAVPFFLAASFYLMTSKLYTSDTHFSVGANFKSRFARLIVPYFCWSTIYLILRTLLSLNAPNELGKLFQDPVRLIFLGGASFHLYFLPLLFSGSFLLIAAEYLAKKYIRIITLVFLLFSSIIIYEMLIISGNAFELGQYCFANANSCSVAFQGFIKLVLPGNNNQLLRVLLVEISWLLQCLPYVLIGMLLHHPFVKRNVLLFNTNFIIFFIAALILSIFGILNKFQILYFPQALYEVGTAFFLLLCGIALSKNLEGNGLIENLGICTFGIYLMHHLVLTLIAKVALPSTEIIKISPALLMITLAMLSFFTSWIITSLLLKKKLISSLLFGN